MSNQLAIMLIDEGDPAYNTLHLIQDPQDEYRAWLQAQHDFDDKTSVTVNDPRGGLVPVSAGSPENDKAQWLVSSPSFEDIRDLVFIPDPELDGQGEDDDLYPDAWEQAWISAARAELARRQITSVYEGLWY